MIKNTKDRSNLFIKTLVYGASGIGKTFLAKTIKNNKEVLILSFEDGLLTLQDFNIDYIDMNRVDNKTIPNDKKLDYWMKVLVELSTKKEYEKYKWIFLDSITEMSHQLHNILLPKFLLDKSIDMRLYNEFFIRMRGFIKALLSFPANIVCLALPHENESGSIGIDSYGKMKTFLPNNFDEVFYYTKISEKDNDKRILLTDPTKNIVAKDRSGKLEKLEEPNLQAIHDKIIKP